MSCQILFQLDRDPRPMNKIVSTKQTEVPVHDTRWVADIGKRQLGKVALDANRSIVNLFLKNPYALGYAIGFAEQACWHANGGDGEKISPDYLRNVIGHMLGNDAVAASFVSFAATKQGDRLFEGGYDAGQADMDALYLSYGEHIPCNLEHHLRLQSNEP